MTMTDSGVGSSSFSFATTVFVSLAICAIVSYGVFYYFKQRISVIEQSQMEQARIMQSFIARSIMQQQQQHPHQQQQQQQPQQQQPQQQQPQQQQQQVQSSKEITITQNGLIEVSSDSESEYDSDSDSDSQSSDSETKGSDKWSIGDEIHQPDGYFEKITESFKKNILIDAIEIDGSYGIDSITVSVANADGTDGGVQQKKIISLNKGALGNKDADKDADDDDDDDDDDDSSSSEDQQHDNDNDDKDDKDKDNDNDKGVQEFELKIGYKPSPSKTMHLNYGNMSVPALRQLAKERGLGGEDGDLQKLKKKDLVQLLQ